MPKLNIIDAMRQQDRLLDAQMKAKMVELCFQAFMDPEDFEKRFKQLPQEQQDKNLRNSLTIWREIKMHKKCTLRPLVQYLRRKS